MNNKPQIKQSDSKVSNTKDNISVLRILSCFMVFAVHFGQRMELTGIVREVTDFGSMGVYLFFLLSGYLSFYASTDNCIKYYLKRAIRILPPYYMIIAYFFVTETFIFNYTPTDETGLYWFRYIFLLAGNISSEKNSG